MDLIISVHFVLCPVASFIFARDFSKGKIVKCEIHFHGNDLWICFAGYKYNFIFRGCFWIECLFHIDIPLPLQEVFCMVMPSRNI